MPFLPAAQRALVSKINNAASGALKGIKSPLLRGAAGQLIDNLLPGFGGGTPILLTMHSEKQ
jgi:hypothetical protein